MKMESIRRLQARLYPKIASDDPVCGWGEGRFATGQGEGPRQQLHPDDGDGEGHGDHYEIRAEGAHQPASLTGISCAGGIEVGGRQTGAGRVGGALC